MFPQKEYIFGLRYSSRLLDGFSVRRVTVIFSGGSCTETGLRTQSGRGSLLCPIFLGDQDSNLG